MGGKVLGDGTKSEDLPQFLLPKPLDVRDVSTRLFLRRLGYVLPKGAASVNVYVPKGHSRKCESLTVRVLLYKFI